MRLPSTRPAATRTMAPPSAPTLAGTVLLAAAVLMSAPAPLAAASLDPWQNIVVVPMTDAAPSAYDAALDAADAAANPQPPAPAPAPQTAEAEDVYVPFDPDAETAEAPSLWTALELGIGAPVGAGAATPAEAAAPDWLPNGRESVAGRVPDRLPTRMELRQGAANLSVSSKASAVAPVSGPLGTTGTSGSGEITGRVGVEQDFITVYTAGTLGASASGNTASLYDGLAVGSTYAVPLAPVGLGDQKLGASVELNDGRTVTTGVELRAPVGSAERFISVQRSQGPDADASGVVKAGVLGKF